MPSSMPYRRSRGSQVIIASKVPTRMLPMLRMEGDKDGAEEPTAQQGFNRSVESLEA